MDGASVVSRACVQQRAPGEYIKSVDCVICCSKRFYSCWWIFSALSAINTRFI